MQETKNQNCPLCQEPAEFELRDHKNRKHFWCNTCTEFQISVAAEKVLALSLPERRSECSEKAKQSSQTHVLVITRTSPQQQDRIPDDPLHIEYVLRSELP